MEMRAAVLRGFGAPMKVETIEVDDPGPGEVRVRIAASGVCGSDLKAIDGHSPVVRHLPAVLGHESAGVVDAVGPDVTSVRPGDHVIIAMNGPCGRCPACRIGRFALCAGPARVAAIQGLTADGGTRLHAGGAAVRPFIGIGAFAEYAVVTEPMCVTTDPSDALDLVCLLACGVVTGVGAVLNAAQVEPGSSVLVVGCGGVGLNAVQGAAIAGATTIIAADVVGAKLDLAVRFGATHTIRADAAPLADQVAGILRGSTDHAPGGVDYAFDATGRSAVLADAFAATRTGGTTVMVGSPPADDEIRLNPQLLFASRRLLGTQGGNAVPARDLPMLAALHRNGRLNLTDLATEHLPLDAVNEAVHHVRAGTVARSIITFDP
ncbi:MAG TPA: alcohol dehydrogenase catalytic domain-containing protein [Streptosporangiaceae bacterium]|jgi:S-(hydroxymethyl)glutathione dehydrogenase/alcohol dehydrogenase